MEPTPQSTAVSGGTSRDIRRRVSVILDRYILGRELGRGTFAKVHIAKSLTDDSCVAIKIIEKPKCAEMQSRITREISAMRRLRDHPNILKIHEVMATKSKIYLVMELATGGELGEKLTACGRLTERAARRYLQQLVSALDFCHQNGVAHRDIKPQNLLLDQSNNIKVSDFGLSALPEQIIKDGLLRTACGTPAYTAPEVISRRNGGYHGAKADAWSCGVLLYVFLAGFLPFDDTNLIEMYKKIHRREFSFPDWITLPAKRIIWHLLDPNPNTRLSIESLKTTAWFKKSLRPKPEKQTAQLPYDKTSHASNKPTNAFDIISMSSGLDLSGLFEAGCAKERRRITFTSAAKSDVISQRVRDVGGTVGLGRMMKMELMEIGEEMTMVEIEAGCAGDEVHWAEFKAGIADIVLAWHDKNEKPAMRKLEACQN